MTVLVAVLSIILVGVCAFVVFLILGQDVKGGGLAGALSGGSVQSAFGSRTTETVLKLTGGLVVAVFLLVIALIVLQGKSTPVKPYVPTSPIESPALPAPTPPPATPANP